MTASFLLCREGGHKCNEKNSEQVKLEGAKLRDTKKKKTKSILQTRKLSCLKGKSSELFIFVLKKKKKGNKSPPGHGSSAGDLVKV